MKNKLYIVAILTLFLVSFIFFTVFAVKDIKTQKEKDTCINEQKTKIEILEKECETTKAENNELTIKVNELTEENSKLVKLIEEVQEDMIQIEPEPVEALEEPTPIVYTEEEETTTKCVTEEPTTQPVTTEDTETVEEPVTEAVVEDNSGNGLRYSASYDYTDNHLTRSNGVVHYNGHKETWYSTNEAGGQATARTIPGKHVADDGTIRDADGYICVATHQGFYQYGDVIQTTLGPAKVYDCGCSYGTVDIYTTW